MPDVLRRLAISLGALRRVLRNPDLRRLESAWALGTAAQYGLLVALLVYSYDEGGPIAAGILGLFRTLPMLVGVPAASTLGDRVSRARLLTLTYGLVFAGTAGAAVALEVHAPLVVIFALAALIALAADLVRPIQNSLLPSLARSPDDLIAGNVAASAGEGIGVLVGPAVAGLLLALGPAATAGAAALAALLAAAIMAGVRPVETVAPGRHARGGLRASAEALAARPATGLMLVLFGVQPFVRGALTVLVVVMSIEVIGLGEPGVGVLNSAHGLGGILGSVGALALVGRPRLIRFFWAGLVLWGVPIILAGLLPFALVAFVGMVVIGSANAVLDVSGYSLIQRTVPNDVRSSVMGLFEGYVAAMVGLGGIVAPVLVAWLGIQPALVVTGLILPILATAALPVIRHVDDASVVPVRELALLRGVPMFEALPMTVIEELAGALVPVELATGETLMREGEAGDCFFVVVEGTARVTQEGRLLRDIGPGAYVGEIALLRGVPRTATVEATSPLSLLSLDSATFVAAVTGDSAAAGVAGRVIDGRLANATE